MRLPQTRSRMQPDLYGAATTKVAMIRRPGAGGSAQRSGAVLWGDAWICVSDGSDKEFVMGSLVPSLSLSHLRASWNWSNRPAYQFKIRHQFELGGFDVKAGPGIDLDPMGLDWMRTLELLSRNTGIAYRMILFDDLDVILPGFPGQSPEALEKMYGNRFRAR